MDGHASNADDAESGGEASPSASGKTDGCFASPRLHPLRRKRAASREARVTEKIGENLPHLKKAGPERRRPAGPSTRGKSIRGIRARKRLTKASC